MDRHIIVEQIRKLLALSKDQAATPAEAANAADKVARLLDKYKLEMADIPAAKISDEQTYERGDFYRYAPSEYDADWRNAVFSACAYASYCYPVYRKASLGATLVGQPADIEVALWMFEYLVREITRLADNKVREIGSGLKWPRAYARKFCNGAAATIKERLEERTKARVDAAGRGDSQALVLVNASAMAKQAAQRFFPNLGFSAGPNLSTSKSAYHEGQRAARGIPINTPMTGARSAPKQLGPGR